MTKVAYKHTFDAKMATNIGEDSVSDVIQAVLELAKNGYDADAENVTVKLDGVHSSQLSEDELKDLVAKGHITPDGKDGEFLIVRKVSIIDDGVAMTDKDLREKYFRLGTNAKIIKTESPKFKRRVVGEKGMGHYAAKRIGRVCTIISNPENYKGREFSNDFDKTITVKLDWDQFQQGRNFTDIESEGDIAPRADPDYHGLTIELTSLNEKVWPMELVKKLGTTLGMLQLPKELRTSDLAEFKIMIDTPTGKPGESDMSGITAVNNSALDMALYKVVGKLVGNKLTTTVYENKKDKLGENFWDTAKTESDVMGYSAPCGNTSFELYHFPGDVTFKGKQFGIIGKAEIQEFLMGSAGALEDEGNAGIKIFNDDMRIMPFGERSHPTLFDWAGLDKRILQHAAGKIRQVRCVGFVRLTRDSNPGIQEVSTRQGIKQSPAFNSLINNLVIPVFKHLEDLQGEIRKQGKSAQTTVNRQNVAKQKVDDVKAVLKSIPMDVDDRSLITSTLTAVSKHIDEFSKEAEEERDELIGTLDMYRPLSTLGLSTLAYGHETQPKLNTVRNTLIGMEGQDNLPEKSRERIRRMISSLDEVQAWNQFLDIYASALSAAKNPRKAKTPINLNDMLKTLTSSLQYVAVVKTSQAKVPIRFSIPTFVGSSNKIHANEAAIISIFTNLLLNSIKSLKFAKRTENPSISIDGEQKDSHLVIRVQDNGNGIDSNNITGERGIEKITKPFFSTYPKGGPLRGMGIGMTLVREIVEEQYRGELSLVNSTYEPDNQGKGSATFEIRIPLKELREPVKNAK